MKDSFISAAEKVFDAKVLSCEKIGGGASGVVYKLLVDKEPKKIAVKTAQNADLLRKESEYIKYISALADIKFPNIYYEAYGGDINFIIMEYFDGVNCSDKYLLKAPKATRLEVAEQIADNIIKLQRIKGDKYGDLIDPKYESWHEFYRPFVNDVARQAVQLEADGLIDARILKAVETGKENYEKIFDQEISHPTPIHGDYWAQNIMIDKKFKLIGVVDPFNCMWADSEYELFALNAIYGKKLPVLEAFLNKMPVSANFSVKNAFYILFSETYWVCKLRHNNRSYLRRLSRRFIKELKRYGVR